MAFNDKIDAIKSALQSQIQAIRRKWGTRIEQIDRGDEHGSARGDPTHCGSGAGGSTRKGAWGGDGGWKEVPDKGCERLSREREQTTLPRPQGLDPEEVSRREVPKRGRKREGGRAREPVQSISVLSPLLFPLPLNRVSKAMKPGGDPCMQDLCCGPPLGQIEPESDRERLME